MKKRSAERRFFYEAKGRGKAKEGKKENRESDEKETGQKKEFISLT